MTQDQLADLCGLSQPRISRWEDEQSEPRASQLKRLAAALHTNIHYLITGEGPDSPSEAGEWLSYRSGVQSAVMRVRMTLEEIEATSDDEAADAEAVADVVDRVVDAPPPEEPPGPPQAGEG